MGLNTYYNFKNPVRHFLNIDNVLFQPDINQLELEDISWTEPLNFRLWKNDDKYRVLKMPNILNFYCALKQFQNYASFNDPSKFDSRKRLVPNIETGDFATGVYDEQLEKDFFLLSVYDNLLKLDIKSYYERIYTHNIVFENNGDERYLTNLNQGNTNGLLMGNYLSLYFAELFLVSISVEIRESLDKENIKCDFSYFSDDFYFFCNTTDNVKVINIFDKVLEKYNLERKDEGIEIWTYLSYNKQNLAERYWKSIISESKIRFTEDKNENKMYFSNQLVYRMSNLERVKFQRTFLHTFFKSTFFHELKMSKYQIDYYNFHNLCFIFQFAPETLLYSIGKVKSVDIFKSEDFNVFLSSRYKVSLTKSFHEEQLYYYYAIKSLGFRSILKENTDLVLETNNQLLISYYLKDSLFNKKQINELKDKKEEKYWFQNYHLILYTELKNDLENSIDKYLIPYNVKAIKKQGARNRKRKSYMDFYSLNLSNKISFIKDIRKIHSTVNKYRELLVDERIEVFGEEIN
ncbi:MAG: hypothetical protein Q8934_16355 [Bacillota bacterium]|nr:hypothetical protein [Bacillota bacterium]